MWHDVSDTINGYTIYPNALSKEFRADEANFAKAVQAIKYFEYEMREDLLVNEIERIGAIEDFYNIQSPDDFFYKIDISKGEDFQLKTSICVSVLTINSHPAITNYYRRIVSDKGEPVFQKYISPITTPDKRDGNRLLYTYTTNSLFRLHAFFYLKSKHNYANTTILNLLGHVTGDTTVIEMSHERVNKHVPTQNDSENVKLSEMSANLLRTQTTVSNLVEYISSLTTSITQLESRYVNMNKSERITHIQSNIQLIEQRIGEYGQQQELEIQRQNLLLGKMDELANLYEVLEKEIDEAKNSEVDFRLKVERAEFQLEQLKNEALQQEEKVKSAKEQLPVPQKQGLLARLFGGSTTNDTVSPVIEVKDFKTAQNSIYEQVESYKAVLLRLKNEIEKKQAQRSEVKKDIASWKELLDECDKLLKSVESQLKELPHQKAILEKELEVVQTYQPELTTSNKLVLDLNNLLTKSKERSTLQDSKKSQIEHVSTQQDSIIQMVDATTEE